MGEIVEVKAKNQVIPVMGMTEPIDGYIWFQTPFGYIANVDEVFYHAESYMDTSGLKDFFVNFLDNSLKSTQLAIKDIKKVLDSF